MASSNIQIRDFFTERKTQEIANAIEKVYKRFDKSGFVSFVMQPFPDQSYSQRLNQITLGFEKYLDFDYLTNLKIILDSLKYINLESGNNFFIASFTKYISNNGLLHFEESMEALKFLTQYFTAEWDVRTFIETYPEKTLSLFNIWSKDNNVHVRRLVSEGSRPFVPWGKKLKIIEENPTLTIPLLSNLYNDNEEYVRKSVANHLNDIAKLNPDLVVNTLEQWSKEVIDNPKFVKLTKQALRTLIKQGNSKALKFLGYPLDVSIELTCKHNKSVKMGEQFKFEIGLVSKSNLAQKLVIDYNMYFLRNNGTHSIKTFKWKSLDILPNEKLTFTKRHTIKQITTRSYYEGLQYLAIQINGTEMYKGKFNLIF